VDCHDPHHPKIPQRKPAPGPHPLHPEANSEGRNPKAEGRKKSEARSPKSEVTSFAGSMQAGESNSPGAGFGLRISGFFRTSDFGLRTCDFCHRARA
jgi:hypothetical protein